jgi:hypothetical protein
LIQPLFAFLMGPKENAMMRTVLSVVILLILTDPAAALGTNRFPFRPFDDVTRPKTSEEVKISYHMLVDKRDGADKLEAKLIALYAMVLERRELGYELGKPRVEEAEGQWQVHIPSKFSINEGRRPPDFLVCVDKDRGNITCFAPQDK